MGLLNTHMKQINKYINIADEQEKEEILSIINL